ncbi:EF-hand domain-containing protein [Arhodomonas aquaeolei]|uniref:EF-hand domain-containing protein n=1 Tax=Arhodomonas aquaeolei TaxID=2369 RepID=UPI0021681D4C|nr:EF-hand domain-containing protein [Arhodomonas aquaeolei]MCS4503571.1 EF-hand domain-containing protein [Arhodomonas aquaeolei]
MATRERARSLVVTIALAGLFASAGSAAADLPTRGPVPFATYDSNGDGFISEAEFAAVRERRMAQRDETGMSGRRRAVNAPPFSSFDRDGDGRLTREEFRAGQRARMEEKRGGGQGPGAGMQGGRPTFADFDLDGDGRIGEAEFSRARATRMGERAQAGYPMRNAGNAPAFGDIDADGNGWISPEEFAARRAPAGNR